MKNIAGLALAIVLALTLVVLVATAWKPQEQNNDEAVQGEGIERESIAHSDSIERVELLELDLDDTGKASPQSHSESNAGSGVLTVSNWLALQDYANRLFDRWSAGQPQPEDLGYGYFDGVIGGGYDPAVRFRINSVSVSTTYLEPEDICRIQLIARPIGGEEAWSFGTLTVDLTMHRLECESPTDLVGQRLDSREGDHYQIELQSYYQLRDDGTAAWGTRWENSSAIYKHFILHIMAIDDGYLIGTVEGLLLLSEYQGEQLPGQRRQGLLIGTFRSRF